MRSNEAVLTWNVRNAKVVQIDPPLPPDAVPGGLDNMNLPHRSPEGGVHIILPELGSRTYTLTAINGRGARKTVSRTVAVVVCNNVLVASLHASRLKVCVPKNNAGGGDDGVALEIISFTATAESDTPELYYDDDTVTLSWEIRNAVSAWIYGVPGEPYLVNAASGTLAGIALNAEGERVFTLVAEDAHGHQESREIRITVRGTFIVEGEFIALPSQFVRIPSNVTIRWNVITPGVTETTFQGEPVALSDERVTWIDGTAWYYLRVYIDDRRLRGTLRMRIALDGGIDLYPWIWGIMGPPRPVPVIPMPPDGVWEEERKPEGKLVLASVYGSFGAGRPVPDIPNPSARPERVWLDEHKPFGELVVGSITGAMVAPRPAPDIPNPSAQPGRVWEDEHKPEGRLLLPSISGDVGAPRPKPVIPTPPNAGGEEGPPPEGVWRDEHKPFGELLIESIFGSIN